MAGVKELFYDIETMFIEGASASEIADELACPIEYVRQVLDSFGVADMPQETDIEYYGA